MERLTVGHRKIREIRKNEAEAEKITPHADFLTAIGLCTMCFMLILSMFPTGENSADMPEAVAVMSNAVENSAETAEREELVMPDKKASAVGEESFFETIGEFFASLIMGED